VAILKALTGFFVSKTTYL